MNKDKDAHEDTRAHARESENTTPAPRTGALTHLMVVGRDGGPTVHIGYNGEDLSILTNTPVDVTDEQLEVLKNSHWANDLVYMGAGSEVLTMGQEPLTLKGKILYLG